jgi:hypothetical protein
MYITPHLQGFWKFKTYFEFMKILIFKPFNYECFLDVGSRLLSS